MKRLIVLVAVAVVCCTAEDEKRRLETVTWDPVRHQLRWIISKGEIEGETYKPSTQSQYEIDISEATMSFSDETRRFDKREAVSVRRLLDALARYAAESTIWWEGGHGEVVRKGVRVSLPAPDTPDPGGLQADPRQSPTLPPQRANGGLIEAAFESATPGYPQKSGPVESYKERKRAPDRTDPSQSPFLEQSSERVSAQAGAAQELESLILRLLQDETNKN